MKSLSEVENVALRKESVDRNSTGLVNIRACILVALRKESVDRNIWVDKTQSAPRMSLSARRAWIEISYGALDGASEMSLSARRAWIEMEWKLTAYLMMYGRSPQGERG